MSISQKSSHQTHEAIVFFAGGEISKEMLYTEFEALLDCVVPMRDFAGKEIQAAYVRLDSGLAVVAVVLFLVRFDADGFPEQRWNVPLRMLAESSPARGPDLGGGPVRLAARSQCPIAGHADNLWDVQYAAGGNTLEQLRERLHSNRLGIDAVDVQPLHAMAGGQQQAWGQAPPSQQAWQQPPQQQAWQQPPPQQAWAPQAAPPPAPAAENSEAVLAVMQHSNQQIAALKEQQQRELMAMQERITELQQRYGELQQHAQSVENENRLLQGQAEEHGALFAEEQRRSERKVQMVIEKARAQTAALRQELQAERDAALLERDRQIAEGIAERERQLADQLARNEAHMQEELARLERERHLHEEQMAVMRAELTDLRRDKLRLMDNGVDKFFASLKEKGVKFVAFQPGAGHLTIPMEDLYRYIEETNRFVAEKCGVSEEHYERWLAHYNNPVCQGSAGHGGPCAKPLTKLLKPSEFVAGLHDRCDIHKQVPRSQPRDKTA